MADCVSLQNAAELVEHLRFSCPKHGEEICIEQQAADAIEVLVREYGKMKAERDAAIEDIKENWLCASCGKRVVGKEWCRCKSVSFAELADGGVTCENYEWRGVKEEEDDKRDHAMRKVRCADAGGIQRQED